MKSASHFAKVQKFMLAVAFVYLAALTLGGPGMILGTPQVAFAQVDDANGVFQMEGNASKDTSICFGTDLDGQPAIADPVGGICPSVGSWHLITFGANTDDWSNIYSENGNYSAASFDPDATNTTSDTAFLGTASKDTDDLSAWTWNPHKAQAKDDIANAFAAAYTINNETIIYAGMDRIANNGASTAGFWFIQDTNFALCTGPGTDTEGANSACTAAGTFVGHHTNGDMLIVSDFSTGGAVSTINIFIWNNGLPSSPDESRSPAPCDPYNDNNTLCGLVNNKYVEGTNNKGDPILEAVTVPTGGWSFSGKGGNIQYLTGEFLEVAVNLNELFPLGVPCFSKFMGETRSSTSVNASLSDLTKPVSFPLCSLSVSKSCDHSEIVSKSGGGEAVRYYFNGNITNTGNLTIYHPMVKDSPPSAGYIADTLKIGGNLVTPDVYVEVSSGSIPGGGSQSYSGQFDSNTILSGSGPDAKNVIMATASSDSSGTPQNVGPDTADWGEPSSCAPPVNPGLSLEKKCQTCLVSNGTDLDVDVSEGVKICNTGNVTISGIVIKDCRGGGTWSDNDPATATCSAGANFVFTLSGPGSLGPGSCQVISTTFTPVECDSRPTGNCAFGDAVIASGTAALNGNLVKATQVSTSCTVCPIQNSCPTYTATDWQNQ